MRLQGRENGVDVDKRGLRQRMAQQIRDVAVGHLEHKLHERASAEHLRGEGLDEGQAHPLTWMLRQSQEPIALSDRTGRGNDANGSLDDLPLGGWGQRQRESGRCDGTEPTHLGDAKQKTFRERGPPVVTKQRGNRIANVMLGNFPDRAARRRHVAAVCLHGREQGTERLDNLGA